MTSKQESSKIYCANLANFYPSFERLRSQVQHEAVLRDNKSYFKIKNIKNNVDSKKTNLMSFFKSTQAFKEKQLISENNAIYSKLKKIQHRSQDFDKYIDLEKYYKNRQKNVENSLKISNEKLKESNDKFSYKLQTAKSQLDNKLRREKSKQLKIFYNVYNTESTLNILNKKVDNLRHLSCNINSESNSYNISQSKNKSTNYNQSSLFDDKNNTNSTLRNIFTFSSIISKK
jgi:hypothetical protein